MLQQDKADDYVISTGETHSVKEFLEKVFQYLDMDWRQFVEIDEKYFRPTEVDLLLGDYSKARKILKWEPKVTFEQLAKMMTDSDMKLAENEKVIEEYEKNSKR